MSWPCGRKSQAGRSESEQATQQIGIARAVEELRRVIFFEPEEGQAVVGQAEEAATAALLILADRRLDLGRGRRAKVILDAAARTIDRHMEDRAAGLKAVHRHTDRVEVVRMWAEVEHGQSVGDGEFLQRHRTAGR